MQTDRVGASPLLNKVFKDGIEVWAIVGDKFVGTCSSICRCDRKLACRVRIWL